tara:strand:+ start:16 stop:1251 length:1236 start_codon:yes stop_codon:yes gene_type:complete
MDIETARHEEVTKTLHQYTEKKNKFVQQQETRYNKLISRKEDNVRELSELSKKVFNTDKNELNNIKESISTIEGNLELCDSKISEINKTTSAVETEIKFEKQKLTSIGTDQETCPVCLKPVSVHDRDDIDSERSKLAEQVESKKCSLKDHKSSLNTITNLKDNLKTAREEQNKIYNTHVLQIQASENSRERIKQLETWNSELDRDLQNFNKETDEFDSSVNECSARLDNISKTIESIKHKIDILDVVKFIVSEEGVKSYIVKKILQVFNGKLSYYLRKMDANCCCIFNEYFEDEIVDEKGKMCSYYNFSGAERKNIDLACLFAFMDIRRLQGNVAYNFSVYDELLDTSLDERGVDLVINILHERVEKYNECIMVISHRKESIKIGTHYKNPGEIIFLEKENGITRQVEFIE